MPRFALDRRAQLGRRGHGGSGHPTLLRRPGTPRRACRQRSPSRRGSAVSRACSLRLYRFSAADPNGGSRTTIAQGKPRRADHGRPCGSLRLVTEEPRQRDPYGPSVSSEASRTSTLASSRPLSRFPIQIVASTRTQQRARERSPSPTAGRPVHRRPTRPPRTSADFVRVRAQLVGMVMTSARERCPKERGALPEFSGTYSRRHNSRGRFAQCSAPGARTDNTRAIASSTA